MDAGILEMLLKPSLQEAKRNPTLPETIAMAEVFQLEQ